VEQGFSILALMKDYFCKEGGQQESWVGGLQDGLASSNGLGFMLSLALLAFLPLPASDRKAHEDYKDLVNQWAQRDGSDSFAQGLVVFALGVEVGAIGHE
jgi:hypothetical protein